jgi:beta-phosphoglucomutase-like phosphatase (HAD superfamily)
VVFEDSISGVKAGKAAGMKVVGVLTSNSKDTLNIADYFVEDFKNISVKSLASALQLS